MLRNNLDDVSMLLKKTMLLSAAWPRGLRRRFYEAAGLDIANKPPPIPSLKHQIVSYKLVKYHFQERKNTTLCD